MWRTNKYADVSQFPMESSRDMQLWERRLLCCVPVSYSHAIIVFVSDNIWVFLNAYGARSASLFLFSFKVPGQNPWTESFCEAVVSPFTNSISPPKENRQREDEVPMDDADMQVPFATCSFLYILISIQSSCA